GRKTEQTKRRLRPYPRTGAQIPRPAPGVADALGLRELLRGPPQLLLRPLSLGNVLHQRYEIIHRAVGAAHARAGYEGIDELAGFVDPALRHRIPIHLASKDAIEVGDIGFAIIGMGRVWPGLCEQLLTRVAEEAA